MISRLTTSSQKQTASGGRRGLTLIEAVVATAIMGTLLVSTLLVSSRLNEQSRRAERLAEASRIADHALDMLWADGKGLPLNASGDVPDRPGWQWKTHRKTDGGSTKIDAAAIVAVLEVYAPGSESPAARVEVLVADSPSTRPN